MNRITWCSLDDTFIWVIFRTESLFTFAFERRLIRKKTLFFGKLINGVSVPSVDPLSTVIKNDILLDTFGLDATTNLMLCFNEYKMRNII